MGEEAKEGRTPVSILDEIEQRERMSVVEVKAGSNAAQLNADWRTVVRLARLAEQAAASVRDGGPFMNTDPEWAKEAWRILHPKPPVEPPVGTDELTLTLELIREFNKTPQPDMHNVTLFVLARERGIRQECAPFDNFMKLQAKDDEIARLRGALARIVYGYPDTLAGGTAYEMQREAKIALEPK